MTPYLQEMRSILEIEKVVLANLKAIIENKDDIIKEAEKFSGDAGRRRMHWAVELNRPGYAPLIFQLGHALCWNSDMVEMEDGLRWSIAIQYMQNPDKPFEFNPERWNEAIEYDNSISYPVDGYVRYANDKESRTVWLNPKRWEYTEYVYAALQSQLKGII